MVSSLKRFSNLSVILLITILFSSFNSSSPIKTSASDDGIPVLVTPLDAVQGYLNFLVGSDVKIESVDFAKKGEKPYLLIRCSDTYVYIWPLRKVKDGYKVRLIRQINGAKCIGVSIENFLFEDGKVVGTPCGTHRVCGF